MRTAQLDQLRYSLEQTIYDVGSELYQLQSKMQDLESEIEKLKASMLKDHKCDIDRIASRLESIERSINVAFQSYDLIQER